jgi:hypothetical protein
VLQLVRVHIARRVLLLVLLLVLLQVVVAERM